MYYAIEPSFLSRLKVVGTIKGKFRLVFTKLEADKEHFVPLTLNNQNRMNGSKVISTGH